MKDTDSQNVYERQACEDAGRVDVLFFPEKKATKTIKGRTLLDAARDVSVEIESACDGRGTCGKCRVERIDGVLSDPHEDERKHLGVDDLEAGIRLACRSRVEGDASVRVLGRSGRRHRILSHGLLPEIALDPYITKRYIELPPPGLGNNRSDLDRIATALGYPVAHSSPDLLRLLPMTLRAADWKVTFIMAGDALIGVEPGDTVNDAWGIALDIGTTTVVASLVDLNSGERLSSASMINPQKDYGLDVLSRIHFVKKRKDGLELMSQLIREGIDGLIREVCEASGVPRERIYEVSVAANCCMLHFFAGVDPRGLGSSPYTPVFTRALEFKAAEVGIDISPFGVVFCLPSVSSYIGADVVGGLLATGMADSEELSLLIDIGTNGEIVIGSREGLTACSCAAGPALEGMNISAGMRAADGAIERVEIGAEVAISTIGDKRPIGLCGSGVIDSVAELFKVGLIDSSGKFSREFQSTRGWADRLVRENGSSRFILSRADGRNPDVSISQKDIRQVQLAKGAIYSGVLALSERLRVKMSEIDRIFIAGAFGHHARIESLGRIGIIPTVCLDKVEMVGNTSKTGAMMCLLSKSKREEAATISESVDYLELSCYPGYDRLFADCLAFPAS